MKTIVLNEEELHGVLGKNIESCVMALGFFDGLHLGHQEVIRQAKVEANKRNLPLAIMSFFPHPKTVLM
ncbi:adenylyltransferase/cytidyltransferase family protein, partial [Mycobacterium tuberculosis]|nr:adenylyltransferase/cytidyltransferase family protein [Mycobacterium tuberculosis]